VGDLETPALRVDGVLIMRYWMGLNACAGGASTVTLKPLKLERVREK
jgi:hypothetical protein